MIPLIYLEECSSTNDEIVNYLNAECSNMTVYSFHQTNGRGQYGNSWESNKNLNVAITFAIKAMPFYGSDVLFNFRTATIIQKFLVKLTAVDVKIKWPNDTIIKNKKVCGFIIEKKKINSEMFYLVGVGINVLQENFEQLPKAGSLLMQTGKSFDLKMIAEEFHQFYLNEITIAQSENQIVEEYNLNLFKKDEVSVFEVDNVRQNGIIRTVDHHGNIWIDLEKRGLCKFFNKEVEMIY